MVENYPIAYLCAAKTQKLEGTVYTSPCYKDKPKLHTLARASVYLYQMQRTDTILEFYHCRLSNNWFYH